MRDGWIVCAFSFDKKVIWLEKYMFVSRIFAVVLFGLLALSECNFGLENGVRIGEDIEKKKLLACRALLYCRLDAVPV